MFTTSEERLQDQLTKTMSVVLEGAAELGGQSAESRRLTYAWRLRHLLLHNSKRHQLIADCFRFLVIIFAFLSSSVAVLFNYFTINDDSLHEMIAVLNLLTFILPLVNTFFNGIFAALNPSVKASILKASAIKIENEIYLYRTKCGPYSMRSQGQQVQQQISSGSKKDGEKDVKKSAATLTSNPRKIFSTAMELIWADLASSDISKGRPLNAFYSQRMHFSLNLILFYIFVGALLNPSASEDPLEDINERIQSNLSAQALLIEALKQPITKHKREGPSSMVDGIDILVSSSSPIKGNMTSQNDANTSFT